MNKQTKIKEKIKKTVGYLVLVLMTTIFIASISPVSAYVCRAGDTECENAKANMEQKQSEARNFLQKASSVSELIEQLNDEIEDLDKSIASNEAKIKKLNKEIKETEEKLKERQTALAELLINMHFSDDSEPIRILAGSKSISDYAEKAAREEVAKQEVALASEKVKETKLELDRQKAEVELALEASESEKIVVDSKRENQKTLLAAYEKNANDASIAATYWENQVRAMAWRPPENGGSGRRSYDARNTYPYGGNCGPDYVYEGENLFYPYGGLVCQCTDYASYKAYERWGIMNTWGGDAWAYIYASGYYVPNSGANTYVDQTPAANTIAIWPATWTSPYGHVQWVESVNANGTINVTEYNVDWPENGCYVKDFCARDGVSAYGASFLHFE